MGRPTKLTPKVQERICEAIRDGNYLEAAAARGGIAYSTMRDWVVRAEAELDRIAENPGRRSVRKEERPYLEFLEAITRAEQEAEAAIVEDWKAQTPDDWRACRDFLARRFAKRWGPKSSLDVSTGGKPIIPQVFRPADEEAEDDD